MLKSLEQLSKIKEAALNEYAAIKTQYESATAQMIQFGFIAPNKNGAKVAGTRKRFDLIEVKGHVTKEFTPVNDVAASVGMTSITLYKGLEKNKSAFTLKKKDATKKRSAWLVKLA